MTDAPPASGRHLQKWQERVTEPSLTALVIVELIAIFVAAPLTDLGHWTVAADLVLLILIMSAGVLVVWRSRTAVVIIAASFVLSLVTTPLRAHSASPVGLYVDFAAKLTLLGVLTWVVGSAVFGPGRVTFHRIQGAIAIYLQISLLFTYIYLAIASTVPHAFRPDIVLSGQTGDVLQGARGGPQLMYFSLVTLTSMGYGDIVPLYPIARSLATLEAVIGQLFPATILARLVTLELEGRRR
jgi:Ion channel